MRAYIYVLLLKFLDYRANSIIKHVSQIAQKVK